MLLQRAGSVGLAVLAVALAGCLTTSAPESLDPAGGPQATDPAGLASAFATLLCEPLCNVRMSVAAGPANEVAIAMDPRDPLRLLAGAKDYNDAYTDCVTISWFFSEDGGRTWEEGYFHEPRAVPLPHPPAPAPLRLEAQSCESDPVPVFDGQGNALMSTLSYGGEDPGPGLPTYRRAPGGAWAPVAHAYEGTSDKQWADVDPATGHVYVVTRDLKEGAEHDEQVVKTRDGGATWEHVAWLDGIDFAQIAVRPGGDLFLAGLDGDGRVVLHRSPDDGATWDPPVTIAELRMGFSNQPLQGGNKLYRTPPLPVVAAADAVPRIAVGYFDVGEGGDLDVFVRVSRDGGATWDPPVRVPDDATGADQWTPAVALSPSGDVHVLFFDARWDPTGDGHLVDATYAHSRDGVTFDANLRVTEQSFVPYLSRHQNQPFFIGDYLGIAASDREAVMIWPDTRTGEAEVFAAIVGGPPAGDAAPSPR